MARLYTRTGDEGETTLMGGKRASKAHPRVEAMGDVDELNASIGVAMAAQSDPKVLDFLGMVQNTLFTVGAELSVAAGAKAEMPHVTSHDVMALEAAMDAVDPGKITEFVMPRGSMAVSTLHLARAVARRAERHLFALSAKVTGPRRLLTRGTGPRPSANRQPARSSARRLCVAAPRCSPQSLRQ